MNLGFYIDSQQQSKITDKVYKALNSLIENNKVDNGSVFFNDIDYNEVTPKFGSFNCTDIWYFTGDLVVVTIKNALSLSRVINKFKPVFLYDGEQHSALELIAIINQMPLVVQNKQDAKYIKRVTGFDAKILPDEKIENIMEVIDV